MVQFWFIQNKKTAFHATFEVVWVLSFVVLFCFLVHHQCTMRGAEVQEMLEARAGIEPAYEDLQSST